MKALILLAVLSLPALAEDNKSFTQIRAERMKFFEMNKQPGMADFDDLELDLLYQDLLNLSILELSRKYPELTPAQLEQLKTNR